MAVAALSCCCGCGGDISICIGSEETGSGTVLISGLHKLITEEEMIGADSRLQSQLIPGVVAGPISFI